MVKRKALRPRTPASLRKYGLTVDQWKEMLEKGEGRCWICGKGGLTKHLSVDHDHALEKEGALVARGLLCVRCNRALAAWEWSDEVIEKAIVYLIRIGLTRAQFRDNVLPGNNTRAPAGARQKGV